MGSNSKVLRRPDNGSTTNETRPSRRHVRGRWLWTGYRSTLAGDPGDAIPLTSAEQAIKLRLAELRGLDRDDLTADDPAFHVRGERVA